MSAHALLEKTDSADLQLQHARRPGVFRWALLYGLCALLIFAVMAFGAVDEWSTFTLEAGAVLLFLLWVADQVSSREIQLSQNPLYLPALLFFALILLQIALHSSAYGYVTKYEALQYVSYGIVLLVAAECVKEEDTRQRFALIMMIFGTLYAFFAVAQEFTSNSKIYWFHSPQFRGAIYGSYVNHNHYAGLMEMLVPIPLVLTMGHLVKGGKRALVGFCAVLMIATIFLSRSRGGMIAFGLEIIVLSALTLTRRKNPRAALISLALCLLVLAFLLFLGRGQVLGRLGDLDSGLRLYITRDCLRMFAGRPVLGWGLGTFPTVYPRYRSFYTNLFVNEAHNDYAQLLVETGVVGFGLMIWFLIHLFQRAWPSSRRWEFKWDGAVSLAALLGCTGMLFHSFVDFNLQIPANAAVFYALCGLATTQLPKSNKSSRHRSRNGDEATDTDGVTEI